MGLVSYVAEVSTAGASGFWGVDSLTRLAIELGFSSHSHFTASFRREFGMTPSALRSNHRAPH